MNEVQELIREINGHVEPEKLTLWTRLTGWQFIVFVIVLAGIASFFLDRRA